MIPLRTWIRFLFLSMILVNGACYGDQPISESSFQKAFGDLRGAFILIHCLSGEKCLYNRELLKEKLPPCSTFKIWNSLIGFETGILPSPDSPFYKWDGKKRSIPEWNRDLTLKEAFKVSCVPAFQNLAKEIGIKKMQAWLDKIGYGDGDLSAGIDVFWLPEKGRKTILISPEEQASLMMKLANGKLPFSPKSIALLRELMRLEEGSKGILYGKTGSGMQDGEHYNLGWFVGYVKNGMDQYAFACVVKGKNLMGKDARKITENLLKENELI